MSADEPTIGSLPDAIGSVVNRLVENEGASFPFLVAAVGLNGSIWYGRVELIDAENGRCSTVAEKLVEGGFTFPINIMVIDSRGKGYLADRPTLAQRNVRLAQHPDDLLWPICLSWHGWSPFAADCYSQIGCVSGEQVRTREPVRASAT